MSPGPRDPSVVFLAGQFGDELVDRSRAMSLLRCDDQALDRLIADGLPSLTHDGSPRFGYCDVMNAGLYHGSRFTVAAIAERYLVQFCRQDVRTWAAPRRWSLSVQVTCPQGCRADDRGRLPVPDTGCLLDPADSWAADGDGPAARWRLQVRSIGRPGSVTSPIVRDIYRGALDDLETHQVRYQYLPRALRRDAAAARSMGVGDCLSVAMSLHDACTEVGVPSRLRRGYLLGLMPIEHIWLDAQDDDGAFKPLDPVLAALAKRSAAAGEADEFFIGSTPATLVPWPGHHARPIFTAGCEHSGVRTSVTAEQELAAVA